MKNRHIRNFDYAIIRPIKHISWGQLISLISSILSFVILSVNVDFVWKVLLVVLFQVISKVLSFSIVQVLGEEITGIKHWGIGYIFEGFKENPDYHNLRQQ